MIDQITLDRFEEIVSAEPISTMSYCTCGGSKCHRTCVHIQDKLENTAGLVYA